MDVSKLIERLDRLVKAIGAAISIRNWHMVEKAHAELRDYLLPAAHASAAALTAERERADKAEKELAGANAALSLQGYGADTHAGLVAAREKIMEIAQKYKAERDDLTRQLAEAEWEVADANGRNTSLTDSLAVAERKLAEANAHHEYFAVKADDAERQLAEAVELVERWLKADDIGIGLDIREARESARAFIQKQEAGQPPCSNPGAYENGECCGFPMGICIREPTHD